MKKQYYLLASAMMLVASAAQAQGNELFFSEYAEGAHVNGTSYGGTVPSVGSERAVEIYNPTTSTVSLNPYSVRRYANGSLVVTEEEKLFRSDASQQASGTNSLNPSDAFVLVCGEATLPDLRTNADQFSVGHAPATGPTVITGGGVAYFNGDDAVALVRYPSGTAGQGAGVIIDLIGVMGEQPRQFGGGTGTGNWGGYNALDNDSTTSPPTGVRVSSANQTIQRRANISTGVRNNPQPFQVPGSNPPAENQGGYNIADEWVMYSTAFNGPIIPPATTPSSNPGGQLYNRFGDHLDYTGPHGAYQVVMGVALGKFNANISIYPNPAHGTAIVDIKDAKVGSVLVLNSLGQRIAGQAKGAGQEQIKLDISGLKAGLYFVQIISADGAMRIYKELVVQ
jgi:hypothetical protein